MSADAQPQAPADADDDERTAAPAAALPVLAREATVVEDYRFAGEISRGRASTALPAVQAAAAAAGGFVAGAAVVGLMTRGRRHSAALAKGRGGRRLTGGGRRRGGVPAAGELVQIVGSRSLLLDVHLLGGRE
jgi:hypothetical protein